MIEFVIKYKQYIFEIAVFGIIVAALWGNWHKPTVRKMFGLTVVSLNIFAAFLYISTYHRGGILLLDALSASFLHIVVAHLVWTFLNIKNER